MEVWLHSKKVKVMIFMILLTAACLSAYLLSTHSDAYLPNPYGTSAHNDRHAYKDKVEERFAERRNHVMRECQARPDHYYVGKVKKSTDNYLEDDKHHLVYCVIPKNACSFWKRVFSILDGKHNGSAVFNLSSVAIHTSRAFGRLGGTRGGDKSFLQLYHSLQSSKKIMFVRDPYERLFSGYIDKIFSPCSMMWEEKKIVNLFRDSKPKTGHHAAVSFTEFLLYVTNQRSVTVDQHFRQQHTACLPCHVDYDYIGKLETFQQDAEYILKEAAHIDPREVFGASEQFEENSDLNIMYDVAMRSFKWCHFRHKSATTYNSLHRLWVTFQVRGYISAKIKLPVKSQRAANNVTLDQFLAMAVQAYRQSGPDRALVKAQRQQALLEAFYSVPRSLLQRVQDYVSDDCLLFNYTCAIDERFNLSLKPVKPVFHMNEALGLWKAGKRGEATPQDSLSSLLTGLHNLNIPATPSNG